MIGNRVSSTILNVATHVFAITGATAFCAVGAVVVSHQHGLGELGEAVNRIDAKIKVYLFVGLAIILAASIVTGVLAGIVEARPPRLASRDAMVRGAGRLLPATARQEHVEEWRSWLRDLREAGAPRRRRLVEMLSILFVAAPKLAVILRLDRQVVE